MLYIHTYMKGFMLYRVQRHTGFGIIHNLIPYKVQRFVMSDVECLTLNKVQRYTGSNAM